MIVGGLPLALSLSLDQVRRGSGPGHQRLPRHRRVTLLAMATAAALRKLRTRTHWD